MTRQARRKRETLTPRILDGPGPCDCCFVELPAGEVVIHFDGLGEPGQARDFCLDCVSGVLLEARGNARAQARAKPIYIYIRRRGTDAVEATIELKGGPVTARRALGGLSQKVDFDTFWVDSSKLEEREQQKASPGG